MERLEQQGQIGLSRAGMGGFQGQETVEPAQGNPAQIQVIWGPLAEPMAVGGMTVGVVRGLLEQPLNIPGNAAALVNGRRAAPRYELQAGDVLEFTRPAGEKGGVT